MANSFPFLLQGLAFGSIWFPMPANAVARSGGRIGGRAFSSKAGGAKAGMAGKAGAGAKAGAAGKGAAAGKAAFAAKAGTAAAAGGTTNVIINSGGYGGFSPFGFSPFGGFGFPFFAPRPLFGPTVVVGGGIDPFTTLFFLVGIPLLLFVVLPRFFDRR